ncbi:DNA polymerase III subunit beta [Adhaeretor mobilis]|uniref:Beta sliding clamp n=1 Tax=Adhaeretor mobilis TaxID=1930276 RepID=A0A517MPE7_9BACT|nr:DNA polymerase III subunit beta [Adhaeretor mobilis]QDS96744.1 DNA polymerase III subunit beta [Adhaeretor mobilis]
MKVSCDREQLLAAFQTVAAVAPTRSPKPILQNVKLEVTEEGATLTATDLEISVRHSVDGVDVQTPGSALLSVSRFGSILRESVDQTLQIESGSSGATIRGERSQFQLPAENPAEFPKVTTFEGDDYYELPARLLRELVRRTAFATDNESSRYALGGIKLEFEDDNVTAIGTDGRRLAKMTGPITCHGQPIDPTQNTIVPTRAMTLIERAVAPNDAEVKLAVRGNEFVVQTERATIAARLLEGRFPDWKKVFPDSSGSQKIDLAVGPTHAAVRQAAIVTSDESRGIDFTFGDGMLVLAGKAAEVGQSRVELPIGYDGDEIVIMLDPKFLMEFLKVLDADKTFAMELKNADSAAVCVTDDGFGYVIMPLARDR